jgi:AIPR protein
MTGLDEYHQSLIADIRREADASGVMMVEAFFDQMAERLTEAGELDAADRAFYENGEGGQKLRIDGYAGDPRDCEGVLGLIVCDFVESVDVRTFGKSDVPAILNPLIRFLKKARTDEFRDALNEVSPAFQISDLIITTWSQITKVKLILISNRQYIGRDDAVKLAEAGDTPITYSVWDLARFERYDRSGQAREDMVIDFAKDFGGPLPALKASQAGAALESYLMIVPGQELADIYDKWGARLLEANVRSFLQARAKTNKGIQKTIRDEPDLFFPFNNGLSATADAVTCVQTAGGLAVASVNNLQIVNGAQTTGSIHAGLKGAKDRLPQVFVQMKLTVVPADRSEDIVPKISEYANTQNKVNAADFFSNHPFHVRMEQFSRSVIFAPKEGERHDSKWFYERSRGQYINAHGKLTAAQQKKFDLEFPKAQLFSKTDLAKLEFSATGQPHIVSRGAQKNFAEFAKEIGEAWTRSDTKYDELWFKRLISKALMFRKLEAEVPKQAWYEGGYRANIVTYAMAKVFHDANREKQVLDVDAIWRRQSVPGPLVRALMIAAAEAHDAITHPPQGVRNMSEWAKQQACWNGLKSRKPAYDDDFENCLAPIDEAKTTAREARSEKVLTDGINAQAEVVTLGSDLWKNVLKWGQDGKRLTPKELQILQICASMPRLLPTDYQSKHALGVLDRLRGQGFGLA